MAVDEFGRLHPPQNADEVESVIGFLEYQRATLRWKCAGLGSDGGHGGPDGPLVCHRMEDHQ